MLPILSNSETKDSNPADPAWDYRYMMNFATEIFNKLMQAKKNNDVIELKQLLTPACYIRLQKEIQLQKEENNNLPEDILIESTGIIGATNLGGNLPDVFEAIFVGRYNKEGKQILFSKRLEFTREKGSWLLSQQK